VHRASWTVTPDSVYRGRFIAHTYGVRDGWRLAWFPQGYRKLPDQRINPVHYPRQQLLKRLASRPSVTVYPAELFV
jgi:hypothetical protein